MSRVPFKKVCFLIVNLLCAKYWSNMDRMTQYDAIESLLLSIFD